MSLRGEVRKGVAEALRWVRDHLTEEVPPQPVTEAGSPEVGAPAEASATPVEDPPGGEALARGEDAGVYDAIVQALHTIYDPEIPVDIYDLGLIYGIDVDAERFVRVRMSLTSPNCPSAQQLPEEVEVKVGAVEGVSGVEVEVVWDPPWTPDRMSEEARLELNV